MTQLPLTTDPARAYRDVVRRLRRDGSGWRLGGTITAPWWTRRMSTRRNEMKTQTLFRAYQATQSLKRSVELRRGTGHGIAVQSDPAARDWQRYDRLARKLVDRIGEQLDEANELLMEARDMLVTDGDRIEALEGVNKQYAALCDKQAAHIKTVEEEVERRDRQIDYLTERLVEIRVALAWALPNTSPPESWGGSNLTEWWCKRDAATALLNEEDERE